MRPLSALQRAVVFSLFIIGSSYAQGPVPSPSPGPQQQSNVPEPKVAEPPHDMTAADVGAFLDGFMPMQIEREDIAGAVVLVVKDGKVLFARGYGYSDVEKRQPVTVDATLFRPGSISKLFTWTAVMQLVEQGKLDLDRDINSYLDFKIPATFPQPITLRHIMTHTPGFEEQIKDLIHDEHAPSTGLRQLLISHIPERIYPPGTTPAYSNFGAGLAGYIVERVSGQPFNDYISENIFKPLGMPRSTFAQPLPPEFKPLMSNGYTKSSGKPKPFEYIDEAPAGALSATAADIARFMLAHLQDGSLDGAQILKPETAKLMHSRQFGLHPDLNGMCLGFYEERRNGHRIIGHGGDTIYFHSDLHLIPDAGVGFFVSYNSRGKGEISPRTALWHHFLDRYFPYQPPAANPPSTAAADGKSVSGEYISSRRSEGNFLRISNMLDQTEVKAEGDGKLIIEGSKDFNGQPKKWQEIGPLLYRSVNGQDLVAFRRDDHGRLLMVPNFPAIVEQHSTAIQNGKLNQIIMLGALGIMALTLLFWPVNAVIRSHYHHRLELEEKTLQGRLWIRLVCALNIIFVLALIMSLSGDDPSTLNAKNDWRIHLIQVVGVLGAAGAILVIIGVFRSWRDRNLWFWARAWNFLVLIACLGFLWVALYWNVLDFNLNY